MLDPNQKMLDRKQWHPSITEARVIDMVKRRLTTLDNLGVCLKCGEEANGVEPDAENYTCGNCDSKQVFGAEVVFIVI